MGLGPRDTSKSLDPSPGIPPAARGSPRRRIADEPRRPPHRARLQEAPHLAPDFNSGYILIPVSHVESVGWIADTGVKHTRWQEGHDVPAVTVDHFNHRAAPVVSSTHPHARPKVPGGDRIGSGGWKHPFRVARSPGKSAVELPPPTDSVKTVKTIKSVKTIKTVKTVQTATLRAGDPITRSRPLARLARRRITSFLPHAAELPHGAL